MMTIKKIVNGRTESELTMTDVVAIGNSYKQLLEQLIDVLNENDSTTSYKLQVDDDISEQETRVEEVEAEDADYLLEEGGDDEEQ